MASRRSPVRARYAPPIITDFQSSPRIRGATPDRPRTLARLHLLTTLFSLQTSRTTPRRQAVFCLSPHVAWRELMRTPMRCSPRASDRKESKEAPLLSSHRASPSRRQDPDPMQQATYFPWRTLPKIHAAHVPPAIHQLPLLWSLSQR